MMTDDEKKRAWLAAYCAALTGLVGTKARDEVLAECRRIADGATEDFEKRWTPYTPPGTRPPLGRGV